VPGDACTYGKRDADKVPVDVFGKLDCSGKQAPQAKDNGKPPAILFDGLPKGNTPAECQSFINLLNTPPASADAGAVRFGDYVLNKRAHHSTLDVDYGLSPEDNLLANADIYTLPTDHPLPGPFPGKFVQRPAYLAVAKRVFGQTVFDFGRNHNEILDANLPQILQQAGVSANDHVSLINVDAHSDIAEGHGYGSYADWVNKALLANPNITDFYWVTPDEFATGDLKKKFYPEREPTDLGKNLQDSLRDEFLFCSNDGSVRWNSVSADYTKHPEKWRIVQFHKRTLSEMPDMHGEKVVLSTDLDYFDNRGFDTAAKARVKWKGDAGFEQYLNTLDQKGIRPVYHFVSASPEYVTQEHMFDLLRFTAYLGDSSKDGVPLYFTHHNNFRDATELSNGVAEPEAANRGAQLIWRMFSNDLKTTQPDGRVVIDKHNEERTAVIRAAMKIYRVGPEHALDILRRLDAADGTADGVIDFRLINYTASRVCKDK